MSAPRFFLPDMALKATCLLTAGLMAARLLPGLDPALSLPDNTASAGLLPSVALLQILPSTATSQLGWAGGIVAVIAALLALPHRSLTLPLLLAFPGFWLGLAQGGLPLWVGACYLLAAGALARNMASAGLLTGLGALRPEQAIATPLMLFWRGQWGALLLGLLVPIGVLALLWRQHGTDPLLVQLHAWQQTCIGLVTTEHSVSAQDTSFYASLRLLGIAPWPALVAHALLALIGIQILWRVCRRAIDPQLPLAAAVTASLLLSPFATTAWLSLLLMPLLIILRRGQRYGWQADELLVVLATFLSPLYTANLVSHYQAGIAPVLLLLFLYTLKQQSRLDHHG